MGSGGEKCVESERRGRMPSWQARVLEAYLAIKRRFSDQSGELDVARERADVESTARMFKPLCAIQCAGPRGERGAR